MKYDSEYFQTGELYHDHVYDAVVEVRLVLANEVYFFHAPSHERFAPSVYSRPRDEAREEHVPIADADIDVDEYDVERYDDDGETPDVEDVGTDEVYSNGVSGAMIQKALRNDGGDQ